MRKFFLLFTLLVTTLCAQSGLGVKITDIKGVSFGYSCRPIFLFGTKTGTTMYPTHMLFFNIDGIMNTTSGSSSDFFGGLGVIAGFSARHERGLINSKNEDYYSSYYRITSLKQETGDMMMIGGNWRIMGALPFTADYSIIESYINFSLELSYMGLNYYAEAGGFNNYVTKKISEGGLYFGFNLGIKLFLVELYGGAGCLFGLYTKAINLSSNNDEAIANPPKNTNHFVAQIGLGLVFDLHAMH